MILVRDKKYKGRRGEERVIKKIDIESKTRE